MRDLWKKAASFFLAAALILTLAVPSVVTQAASAGESKQAPTDFSVSTNFGWDFKFSFSNASDWLSNITGVQVNGTEWTKGSSLYSVWNNSCYYVDSSNNELYIGE